MFFADVLSIRVAKVHFLGIGVFIPHLARFPAQFLYIFAALKIYKWN